MIIAAISICCRYIPSSQPEQVVNGLRVEGRKRGSGSGHISMDPESGSDNSLICPFRRSSRRLYFWMFVRVFLLCFPLPAQLEVRSESTAGTQVLAPVRIIKVSGANMCGDRFTSGATRDDESKRRLTRGTDHRSQVTRIERGSAIQRCR